MKKFTAILITFIIMLSYLPGVCAENESGNEINPETKNDANTEAKTHLEEEKLYAKSPHAILLDMKSGVVLYKKNAGERVFPSDLTKIMTAVLVIEKCNLEELVTASETALSNVKQGDSRLGIVKDEKLSVRQLLYAMIIGSASDAANVLAEKTSGSIDGFVKLMNKKAEKLKMNDTNFTNPTGEYDARHYTTASDMAKLCRYAMNIPEFKEIVKTDSYSIPATQKSQAARKVTSRNHFVSKLVRSDYYYKYSTGIKTGYSAEAKSCIASSAEKDSMSLLALVFEAETEDEKAQSFTDCKNMFDYAFENYTNQKVVSQGDIVEQTKIINTRRSNKLILRAKSSVNILKPKDEENLKITYKDSLNKTVSAPVKKDDVIGKRKYYYGKQFIGETDLLADKDYALDIVAFTVNKIVGFITSPWFFFALAAVVFVMIMAERRRRRILRKKRRDARTRRNREMIEQMEMFRK